MLSHLLPRQHQLRVALPLGQPIHRGEFRLSVRESERCEQSYAHTKHTGNIAIKSLSVATAISALECWNRSSVEIGGYARAIVCTYFEDPLQQYLYGIIRLARNVNEVVHGAGNFSHRARLRMFFEVQI